MQLRAFNGCCGAYEVCDWPYTRLSPQDLNKVMPRLNNGSVYIAILIQPQRVNEPYLLSKKFLLVSDHTVNSNSGNKLSVYIRSLPPRKYKKLTKSNLSVAARRSR